MNIGEFGELHFDMMSPNFRHFGGSKKSHKAERRTQARQCLETFDFTRFGTFVSNGSWKWQDSTSSVVEGSTTVCLKTQQGTECDCTFVVTWMNNKPVAQLKGLGNA